jgi:hypothetical protein
VLEQLSRHGIQPSPSTRPEVVHVFVSDLYRFELRRLRDRLVRKEIPKTGYYDSRRGTSPQSTHSFSLKPHEFSRHVVFPAFMGAVARTREGRADRYHYLMPVNNSAIQAAPSGGVSIFGRDDAPGERSRRDQSVTGFSRFRHIT